MGPFSESSEKLCQLKKQGRSSSSLRQSTRNHLLATFNPEVHLKGRQIITALLTVIPSASADHPCPSALGSPAAILLIISPACSADIKMVHKFDQCLPLEVFLLLSFRDNEANGDGSLSLWWMFKLYVSVTWAWEAKTSACPFGYREGMWPPCGGQISPCVPHETPNSGRSSLTQHVFS